ncbi:MAG: RNA 2',3'-cyclic phosphodiesterase [Parvularculaceae bacterium]
MYRLFVALSIPEATVAALERLQSGLVGARWRPRENFHLTLRFIGETDRHGFTEVRSMLAKITTPGFDLTLNGLGYFGDRKPRALWVGAPATPPLLHLQAKVETAVKRAGFPCESRKFTPHVTLASLKGASRDAAERFCAANGLLSDTAFPVDAFHLYSSRLGGAASHYTIEESYMLSSSR